MEYRGLQGVALESIHGAFLLAFSDYQAPVSMTFEDFKMHLRRNGFTPEVSAGAFEGDDLVGFVLNGERSWNGRKTIYDLGTGTAPAFRKRGHTKKMLDLVQSLCSSRGTALYLLEAIQDNTAAVSLYGKQGFEVVRPLNCYRGEAKLDDDSAIQDGRWKLAVAEKLTPGQWEKAESFWDYPPSWQNSPDSVKAVEEEYVFVVAEDSPGVMVGYGAIGKANGDIPQLAVEREHRRLGLGTAIMSKLTDLADSPKIRMINVDDRDEALNAFLESIGLEVYVRQYEMEKKLWEC